MGDYVSSDAGYGPYNCQPVCFTRPYKGGIEDSKGHQLDVFDFVLGVQPYSPEMLLILIDLIFGFKDAEKYLSYRFGGVSWASLLRSFFPVEMTILFLLSLLITFR